MFILSLDALISLFILLLFSLGSAFDAFLQGICLHANTHADHSTGAYRLASARGDGSSLAKSAALRVDETRRPRPTLLLCVNWHLFSPAQQEEKTRSKHAHTQRTRKGNKTKTKTSDLQMGCVCERDEGQGRERKDERKCATRACQKEKRKKAIGGAKQEMPKKEIVLPCLARDTRRCDVCFVLFGPVLGRAPHFESESGSWPHTQPFCTPFHPSIVLFGLWEQGSRCRSWTVS